MPIYSCGRANSPKKMRLKLKALLFDLWPFKNSAWPWEGLLPPSVYLSIQPIYLQILRRQCCLQMQCKGWCSLKVIWVWSYLRCFLFSLDASLHRCLWNLIYHVYIQNWALREFWEKAHFHRTHFPGVKGEFCCHLPTKWDIFGLKSGLRLLGPLWKWGKGHKGLSVPKSRNIIVLIVILVLVWSSALSGQGIFSGRSCCFFHQMTWFGPLNNSRGVALNFVYFS